MILSYRGIEVEVTQDLIDDLDKYLHIDAISEVKKGIDKFLDQSVEDAKPLEEIVSENIELLAHSSRG